MTDWGMVIVGAGEAGVRAAIELRAQGWSGHITLIGEERSAPYERPPLSKRLLVSEEEPRSPVSILDEEAVNEHDIQFLSGCGVAQIDRHHHQVMLWDGRQIGYERLLLATGARQRRLPNHMANSSDMLYLRSFSDMLTLRKRLQPGQNLAVIGAGFIGLEVAAGAIERGCTVTVFELAPRILMRGVPEEIARMVEGRHRRAGVQFELGVTIERIEPSESGHRVVLNGKQSTHCDAVVIGIGAVPETLLAAACGIEIENGVRVNEFLTTSDPDIFAAGDCCSFPHPLFDGKRIRLEAWRNAQDQGTHVARNMLGAKERYTRVPWFWSDQYDQTLHVTGLSDFGQSTVHRDLGDAGQMYFHLTHDGRLVAASAIGPNPGLARDIRLAEMLIQQEARPDPAVLELPDLKLKALLDKELL